MTRKKININSCFIFIFLIIVTFTGCVAIIGDSDRDNIGHCIIFDDADNSCILVGRTKLSVDNNFHAFIAKVGIGVVNWAYRIDPGLHSQANCVQLDGTDYVLCGFFRGNLNSSEDLLLAKFHPDGATEPNGFIKTYDVKKGESNNREDRATKMIVDNDGNYVIVGTTFCTDPQKGDILVAKFNSNGGWLKAGTVGTPNEYEEGKAIIQDRDMNYVVVGHAGTNNYNYDIVIIKLDTNFGNIPNGSVRLKFSNEGSDSPMAILDNIITTEDPSYIVAGYTTNLYPSPYFLLRSRDLLIFKIDYDLNSVKWSTSLGNGTRNEEANSLIKAEDNNLIVAGFSKATPWWAISLFAKFTESNGDFRWAKTTKISTINPPNFQYSDANCITKVPPSWFSRELYLATGATHVSTIGSTDILLASLIDTETGNNEVEVCYNMVDYEPIDISGSVVAYRGLGSCNLNPGVANHKPIPLQIDLICRW